MPIYKRGQTYWLDIAQPNGQRLRQSARTGNRRDAQQLHDSIKARLWRETTLGERPAYRWEDAATAWLNERGEYPSRADDILWLRWLHPHLYGMALTAITVQRISQLQQLRQTEGVKARSVNAILQTIRAVLRAAERRGWLERVPPIRLLPEPSRRIRYLNEDEEQRLLDALPAHLARIARFALATGLRMSNITGLEWRQIDLGRRQAWIWADQAKGREAIPVPLNQEAVRVLREQWGKHPERVFTHQGQPFRQANGRAWRKSIQRAGLEDVRFHDLRHTWATRHIQAGTPLHALMELGGWKDAAMVRKYAHFSAAHLQNYAENATHRASYGTNPAQRAGEITLTL
ncbi:MAG: site-specific integrase [Candidatus Contendobacter sp.]